MKKIVSLAMAVVAAMSLNATDYYLVGDCNSWSNGNATYKFAEKEGVLTLEVAKLNGGLKIIAGTDWHPQFAAGLKTEDQTEFPKLQMNTPYTLVKELVQDGKTEQEPENLKVDIADKHYYENAVLTLDVTNADAPVLTLKSGTDIDDSATPIYYYLVGAFNNWQIDDNLAKFEEVDGVFTTTVADLNGGFKVLYDKGWGTQYGANDAGDGLVMNTPYTLQKGENNLSLANPFGGYKNAVLTLDTAKKVLTLTAGDFYMSENDWYIPSDKLGWNCDAAQKMTKVAGKENTYELLAAEFGGEFKVVYGSWAIEFVADADDTPWKVNEEYTCAIKGKGQSNIKPAVEGRTYEDCTITVVVDYENVVVKVKIETEDIDETAIDQVTDAKKAYKAIENGQLVIIKNGVRYNALGVMVE